MFVLEALVLTFATTPMVTILYPPHLRSRATVTGASFANVRDAADDENGIVNRTLSDKDDEGGVAKRRFTVILDKLEHLPSMMAITQLLQPSPPPYSQTESNPNQAPGNQPDSPIHFSALRLIELADRPSDVMKSSATETLLHTDPLIAIFRTFTELNGLSLSAALSIVPFNSLATSVAEHAQAAGTQLVLVPWLPSALSHETPDTGVTSAAAQDQPRATPSGFDSLFRADRSASLVHSHFVRGVFSQARTNVALLIGHAPVGVHKQTHLFLPFFGGPDDRLALDFVVQLCANPRVRATVMRITKRDIQADVSALEPAYVAAGKGSEDDNNKAEENVRVNALTITSVRSVSLKKKVSGYFYKQADDTGCVCMWRWMGHAADHGRVSGHDVRQRDDAHEAAVRDRRRDHVGPVLRGTRRNALLLVLHRRRQRWRWYWWSERHQCARAVARDVRGTSEPGAVARGSAPRADARAHAAPYHRRRAVAPPRGG